MALKSGASRGSSLGKTSAMAASTPAGKRSIVAAVAAKVPQGGFVIVSVDVIDITLKL